MGLDPEGVVTFEAAGEQFTAVFGFRAMKTVETHFDQPFFIALQSAMPELAAEDADDPEKIMEAGTKVRISHVGVLFEAALAKHHPGLSAEDIEDLIDEIGLEQAGEIIGKTVASALVKKGADDKSTEGPREKARRKR
jgi:hypothetical protein